MGANAPGALAPDSLPPARTTMSICGETILILANAEWDWANRVNCHHIAARLARDNRVVFVDTIGGRTPAPREFSKIARRLRRIAGGVRHISDGLTVLAPFVIPLYGSEMIRQANTALLAWQIRHALPKHSRPILWVFLPSLVGLVRRFDEKLVIYHCIDQHAANPQVPSRQVAAWEERLLGLADIVFTSSSTLYEEKHKFNPNTFYLPNVADAEHFASSVPAADDLKNISHPIAGFVGNITAYKLNFDLLATVARAKPNWSFVFIGPIGRGDPSTQISSLQALTNVYLLGERPYAELPRYVRAFDACLIPFNQNDSTRGSLPMKFFEYLAAGKPVVATDLPTLTAFREYFYPVHDACEFGLALDAVLHEDPACAQARVNIAQEYSWDARMIEIQKIIAAQPDRPAQHDQSLQYTVKRLFDIVVAFAALVVLSPLLALIALAIRLSSGSPVLYKWQVVGQNGRPFTGYKFRTMVQDADRLKAQLAAQNEMRGPVFKMKDDPRITQVGRILRKFSLDELPQLWSVLKGDMSLVGPRPPLVYEYERFTDQQKHKLAVRPGMTSLWQVSGKPRDFDEWLRLDLEYIKRWSLWLDAEILAKTVWIVLAGKNY